MAEERKRILFVVEAMGGGVFTYLVDLANALVDTYDVYIAYAIRKQTPVDFKDYFDERIQWIHVENFGRSISLTKDGKALLELRRIAKEVKPDIIHLHSSKAGALGRFAFNGKKVPLFYTPHGYSFLMKNYGSLQRTVYKTIEAVCGKRHCTTISCSEGEHQETLKLTKHATYVNNGVNLRNLQKLVEEAGTQENHPFTVFTMGRICYQKNPKQFNELALAMPDVKFLWIGDGELREELAAPNIEVTGWCKREEALKRSLAGDVFVLTSLWEGLPISLLEAMYIKKLCVVSDVIGNKDVIHNGVNGFVCHSVEEYVRAIRIAQNGHVEPYIEKAYADVLQMYNAEAMGKKYSEIYRGTSI